MAATPEESVAFLKARLRPVAPIAPQRLDKLLADLDDKQFAVRHQAEQALEKLGDLAAQAIKDNLALSPTLERTRRLHRLAKKLDALEVTTEVLQTLRAIEVLEMIGTADARQVLVSLSKGAAGHRITEEARAALDQMAQRPPPP